MGSLIKAFQFSGGCAVCESHDHDGGICIALDRNDDLDEFDGEWLCLSCASKIAKRILKAVDTCKANLKAGLVHRNGRWQKPKATPTGAGEGRGGEGTEG